MRAPSSLVLACALALAGCNKGATSAKLEGRWRGVRVEGVSPEHQAAANAFASGTELIARSNQIGISTPTQKGLQTSYGVESESKSVVVIRTEQDGTQTLAVSDDGRTMTWSLDERRRMIFQKQP